MGKKSNGADQPRLETIGVRQLSAEISLGLRSPIMIRAGEVHGGMPGRRLSRLYAHMQACNVAMAVGKE